MRRAGIGKWLWWGTFLLLAAALVAVNWPASRGPAYEPPALDLRPFDTWYTVYDSQEAVIGYSHLVAGQREGGGWDIAFSLGVSRNYRSEAHQSTMVLDPDCRLLETTYEDVFHGISASLVREGNVLKGWRIARQGAERQEISIPLDGRGPGADTAFGYPLFALAAAMPQREGAELRAKAIGKSLVDAGPSILRARGWEDLELFGHVFRYEERSPHGGTHAIWVTEAGEIAGIDWVSLGEHAVRSAQPTEHLYTPYDPVLLQVDCHSTAFLCLEGLLPGFDQEDAFRHFTEPQRMMTWWSEAPFVDPRPGGEFTLGYPEHNQVMAGELQELDPPLSFRFRWHWQGADESKDQDVTIRFVPDPEGTRLIVHQGPFTSDEAGVKERLSVHDGWNYFLNKLLETKKK